MSARGRICAVCDVNMASTWPPDWGGDGVCRACTPLTGRSTAGAQWCNECSCRAEGPDECGDHRGGFCYRCGSKIPALPPKRDERGMSDGPDR